jgi:hypothetical protein
LWGNLSHSVSCIHFSWAKVLERSIYSYPLPPLKSLSLSISFGNPYLVLQVTDFSS